ncbi:DUF3618 domain-containing protein [Jatrophihabitans endophyticus]|uniref:DUF3618 domain-containing protein n=1 Tax=Jatrophihabitans endophyticus TaxID=1206085 RepID=UPI0019DF9041|nr:DUF3618 domain-containing protein [Jatrophihabitans endophyticus]MBE7189462.1 DUF3618 domain-containing protein [Jatrophihabitans endophyticus]
MTDEVAEPDPSDLDAIRSDIEQTRAELADTVEQVADKLNVKSQVGHKTESVKKAAAEKATQAKASTPEPVQNALNAVGAKAGPPAHRAGEAMAPHRGKIIAGLAGGLVIFVIVRRRRSRAG